MKKIIVIMALFLFGCAPNGNESDMRTTVSIEASTDDSIDIYYASGVNADNIVYGDSQNYINIIGFLGDHISTSQVSLIDIETGIVVGITEVTDENKFNLRTNMQGTDERNLILSLDESVNIPKVDSPEDYIDEGYGLEYKANAFIDGDLTDDTDIDTTDSEEEQEKESEETNESDNNPTTFDIGESVEFTSGLIITIDSIEISDEEPNGEIQGNFVRVDFTIDNQSSEEYRANAHDFSLYDGERNKAELNAKNFYSESIAAGMKNSSSAYYDSIDLGPFTAMFSDAMWVSD